MKKLLFVIALLLFLSVPAFSTTYFVGATTAGAANCLTSAANNCLLATAIAKPVVDGDIITMANGTYQGTNSMLTCSGLNGSAGMLITIRATNDGQVLIDGQDARVPIHLSNCDYFDIEGINAGNSSGSAVLVESGSDYNVFRNVIGYDACSSCNTHVWSFDNSSFNLLEDSASFGTGRKQIELFGGSNDNILRRVFAAWHGSTSESGPIHAFALGYDAYRNICENCIGTRDEQFVPAGGYFGLDSIFTVGDRYTAPSCESNNSFFGSIAYVKASQAYVNGANGMVFNPGDHDYITLQDVIAYIEPGTHASVMATLATDYNDGVGCNANAAGGQRKLTDYTEIGFTEPDNLSTSSPNGWTTTNFNQAATVTAAYGGESLYVNDGTHGATVCYQYIDGVLTTNELWPWPMNQRIIDAMTAAGYTAIDIGADIQNIFGTFPDSCESVGGGGGETTTITYDSSCVGDSSGTTITFNCTVADQPNRAALLFVTTGTATATTISASDFNGDSFGSAICTADNTVGGLAAIVTAFKLVAPDTGTHSVSVTFSDSPGGAAAAMMSFYNVDQSTVTRTADDNTGVSSTATVTATSTSGDLVVDTAYRWFTASMTPGSNQTQRVATHQVGADPDQMAGSTKVATSASTAMSWTLAGGSDQWSHCGVALIPAVTSFLTTSPVPILARRRSR